MPSTLDAGINTLPTPDLDDRSAPQPVAHGAAVQAVFNDIAREKTLYRQVYDLWHDEVADHDDEPEVIGRLDHDLVDWLNAPDMGEEWVVILTSSRWKGGTGIGDDYSAWYKYDLTLRQLDEDGVLHRAGKSCSLRVIPQLDLLNYKDGGEITYQYGEGSLVRCTTTWATSVAEIEGRMADMLIAALDGIDRERLREDRNHDSRRIQKAEAHHRFEIGWKRQVIDCIDRTRELIAYGGMSEIDASHTRQRAGYLEAVIDADRWHLLGFERTPFDIELKCYQTNGWNEYPREDPAHHPKIEASFSGVDGNRKLPHVEKWDKVMGVIRSIVSAHLDWAGVGREELVADDYQPGPRVPEYEYAHPTGRRAQLRERFEAVSTQIYREALKVNTRAVYDILLTLTRESGASYDLLEERTGLARSTIRHHVGRLEEVGVVERLSNPVLVVFPSLAVLEDASEILRECYPEDQAEDMAERAEQRRQRREERREARGEASDDAVDSSDNGDSQDERHDWRYFDHLPVKADELATAVNNDWLPGDHIRVRVDHHDWLTG